MEPVTEIRRANKGALHSLLLRSAMPNDNGEATIKGLAELIGISDSMMFKYIKTDKLPLAVMRSIVAHNNLFWLRKEQLGIGVSPDRIVKEHEFIPYLTFASVAKMNGVFVRAQNAN